MNYFYKFRLVMVLELAMLASCAIFGLKKGETKCKQSFSSLENPQDKALHNRILNNVNLSLIVVNWMLKVTNSDKTILQLSKSHL